ncbi:MAG: hypothetical protein R8M45_06480 [Ghiorsea sp.]
MALFATHLQLEDLLPTVKDWGVSDFVPQLTLASNDIVERLNAEWWASAYSSRINQSNDSAFAPPIMDITKLNVLALQNLTIYRALERYILPQMTQDSAIDGDAFTRKETRYRQFYKEEWDIAVLRPLYDFSGDAQFTNIDRRVVGRRLRRA